MAIESLRRRRARPPGISVLWASGIFVIAILSLQIPSLFADDRLWPDDLMRLQQVRDLLSGQPWFDVHQHRLITPEGGDMHWSRLPDFCLAGLISVMSPIFGQRTAETLAVGVWPLVLLGTAIFLIFEIAGRLGIQRIGKLCALAFFMGSAASANFGPGRIDHHNLVVVLVLWAMAALLSRQSSIRSALILSACACAALSVAIESLPYVSAIFLVAGLYWIARGSREADRMTALGVGTIFFGSYFYVFDAPGWGVGRLVCDAYGISHWAGLMIGGALAILIGIFDSRFHHWPTRLTIGAGAAAIVFGVFAWVMPDCIQDPYGDLPETLQRAWLQFVIEAQSLPRLFRHDLARAIWVYGYLCAAFAALIWMMLQSELDDRLAWLSLLVVFVVASVMTAWQVRAQLFSHVFAILAASGVVDVLHRRWASQRSFQRLLYLCLAFVLVSPLTWRFAGEAMIRPVPGHQVSRQLANKCMDSQRFQEISRLPHMRIHTPVDLGVPILFYTDHAVFVGPYHRNAEGMMRAIEVLTGDLERAHQRLLNMGATHLAYCVGFPETDRYGSQWPDSLSAQMNRGNVPAWLVPLDAETKTEGILHLYEIQQQSDEWSSRPAGAKEVFQ